MVLYLSIEDLHWKYPAAPSCRHHRNKMTRERTVLIENREIVAELSLVLRKTDIDRTGDSIRKVYSAHLECYRAIVVGMFEYLLCDDHCDAQG